MKKKLLYCFSAIVLAVCTFFVLYDVDFVEPGYVSLKVKLYGADRGVQDSVLKEGAVWYNRFLERTYEFPVFMQNAIWTKSVTEGSPVDESINFNSVEGAKINTDVALSYQIQREKIPSIFVELRQDADYITKVYMRGKVRDSINRVASTMKVIDIFGEKKEELLLKAKQELDRELRPKGFIIDMIAFTDELRVDPKVEESINMTISASQKAIEAQNKVVQSKAEADQKIEEARGEAEGITLVAEAKAKANKILTESLSKELLQYEALQRWDGVLPRVTGDVVPFVDVTSDSKSSLNEK